MDTQTAIILGCTHPTGRACVDVGGGRLVDCCTACWNASVTARRAARKAQLAERPKDCERCGRRPHTWTYGPYRLCGRCKTATAGEHHRAAAPHGILGMLAVEPLVDTAAWAVDTRRQGRTAEEVISQSKEES
jgi:hypothetical protein